MKTILISTSNDDLFQSVRSCFDDIRVDRVGDKETALGMIRATIYDCLFIDLEHLQDRRRRSESVKAHRELLQPFQQCRPSMEIVVMASHERAREAVMAVKAGASDYLTYPVDPTEVKLLIEDICEDNRLQFELEHLRDQFWQAEAQQDIHTRSAAMQAVFERIRSVAPTKSTVLLTGETGTGKSRLAKLIHRHSHRSHAQFISLHCGAIPETLIESELFGHEKGAFTGADRRKMGKFEIAHEGTLFLDEIGTIPPAAQIKLLMVLQDGEFQRVGGTATLSTDARIIAATNADLKTMTEAGAFRKDLYYRLNVFPIEIPPLRERKEDIPNLVATFLAKNNRFSNKDVTGVHPATLDALMRYQWPGNIRELENIIERAHILERTDTLMPTSLPAELTGNEGAFAEIAMHAPETLADVRRRGIEEIERQYLRDLLARHGGRINASADEAGITTRQLHKLMQKFGIRKEDFKNSANTSSL